LAALVGGFASLLFRAKSFTYHERIRAAKASPCPLRIKRDRLKATAAVNDPQCCNRAV
jgi:hypothetical protein